MPDHQTGILFSEILELLGVTYTMCKGLSLGVNLEIHSLSLLSAQNLLPDRGCDVAGGLSSLLFLCCDYMCPSKLCA